MYKTFYVSIFNYNLIPAFRIVVGFVFNLVFPNIPVITYVHFYTKKHKWLLTGKYGSLPFSHPPSRAHTDPASGAEVERKNMMEGTEHRWSQHACGDREGESMLLKAEHRLKWNWKCQASSGIREPKIWMGVPFICSVLVFKWAIILVSLKILLWEIVSSFAVPSRMSCQFMEHILSGLLKHVCSENTKFI